MLLRRLYSSLPSTRVGGTSSALSSIPSATGSKPSIRGRIKPRSANTSALCKPKQPISVSTIPKSEGNGRIRRRIRSISNPNHEHNVVSDSNRRSPSSVETGSYSIFDEEDYSNPSTAPTSTSPSSPRLLFTHPVPSKDVVEGFRPIYLYPEQFKLHYTFTPSHHPLPLNMGTAIYTHPRHPTSTKSAELEDIFSKPSGPDPTKSLRRTTKSGLGDHHRVLSNLSHPELLHHLGGMVDPWTAHQIQSDTGSGLEAILSSKLNELKESSKKEQEQLERIISASEATDSSRGSIQSKGEVEVNTKDANLDEVVGGLNDVLAKMGLSGSTKETVQEDGVMLDSVKRKRKKKISKHKYKKRRKVSQTPIFISL
ncbi:hypothetical protein L486_07244 [Kwoniella mangroviensis CBS 10435]|uniref:Ribosomal protein mS38 C-terminal domain-containing protein n=1 Tax=Kwoniella mangroviensis CBS 10435 TaxID=1331196 RepID=A0A1B9II29_9TREE|nr:hypothetical protein L486_07244 [Kwoniella mangroviensis CBS 10435]